MKKTGKVKKFADGGLMGAISRMQGGPSKGEMAKMSIADQIAKIPRGGMDAIAEKMAKADAPRGGFLSGMKTKPMIVGGDKHMDKNTAKLLAASPPSDDAEVTLSKKPQPVERKGSSFGSDELRQALMGGRNAEAAIESLSRSKPNQMRDIFKTTFKKGGKVESASSGSTASRRGDGIAQRGKTKGRMI